MVFRFRKYALQLKYLLIHPKWTR